MPDNTIYVRGTRQDVRRAVQAAVDQLTRGSSDAARTTMVRMGLVLLANVKKAFIQKSRGEADESGLRWPPLAKSTIAYSRRHPGVPKSNVRAAMSPSWALTKRQRERWWKLYRQFLGNAPMGAAYHQSGGGWAAARAWKILKAEGAKTLMMRYGDQKVDILRDTGVLLNSLSPGDDPMHAGPTPPPVENQVFRIGSGEVIVGTNVPYAKYHQHGTSRCPQRRLWPEPSRWPGSWWDDIAEQGRMAMIDILLAELRQ